MLHHIPLALSFVGLSVAAFPSLLQTSQLEANVSSPEQIGMPTNNTQEKQPMNTTIGGVFICQNVDWMNCTYTVFPLNTCFDMKQAWNQSISSIGPDNGTLLMAFTESNCTGNATLVTYPGYSNLMQRDLNDRIVSINVLPAPANTSGNSSMF